ncbi:MAG TPA: hypothetical protein VMU84_15445 [Thermoanaerobaculia bacterium]|nr:hypothetical protein [Thermoanaerobaculia bacterium]
MAALPETILDEGSVRFYRDALAILKRANVPHLVGGAYAFARYTGIERHTKDFDVFIRRGDYAHAAAAFEQAGYQTELSFPHWLGKAFKGDLFVDLIFSAGNGVAVVDDVWFENAVDARVFDVEVQLIPAEEMIWSKGLIMERERFDGADVAHVFLAVGDTLDWRRLIDRFGEHWRVLFAHAVLFGYIYPSERTKIPAWALDELAQRFAETRAPGSESICYGTIISRQQYLTDVEVWGFRDARRELGTMSNEDIAHWTAGIAEDGSPK